MRCCSDDEFSGPESASSCSCYANLDAPKELNLRFKFCRLGDRLSCQRRRTPLGRTTWTHTMPRTYPRHLPKVRRPDQGPGLLVGPSVVNWIEEGEHDNLLSLPTTSGRLTLDHGNEQYTTPTHAPHGQDQLTLSDDVGAGECSPATPESTAPLQFGAWPRPIHTQPT